MELKAPDSAFHEYVRDLATPLLVLPEEALAAPEVLMIGLGGGSTARMLLPAVPTLHMDIVELNPAVIDAAYDWFGVAPSTRLTLFQADGRAFLEQQPGSWDTILLDAFSEDYIPFPLATVEFYQAVARRLAPGGIMAANVWYVERAVFLASLATMHQVFPSLGVFFGARSGNAIVVGSLGAHDWSKTTLSARAKELAPRVHLPFELSKVVSTFKPLSAIPLGSAPVLRDGDPAVYDKLTAPTREP